MLDDNVKKNLSAHLTKKTAKRRSTSDINIITVTVLSTVSDVISSTNSVSMSERVLLNAVEDHRNRSLWEIKEEKIVLSSKITELFERWKADSSVFLRSDSSQVSTSLTKHYDYALSVRTSIIFNKILWRFITTAYYDVISALSQSDRYFISKETIAFVIAVICESFSYDREAVEKNIISWAKNNAKNRAFVNKMKDICCYFFYSNISE